MDIKINAHHIDMSDPIYQHAEEKLLVLEKFHEHIISADITLTKDREDQIAKANLHVKGCPTLHAEATTTDIYQSIDKLSEKLAHQLREKHSKQTDHHRKEASKRDESFP